MKLTMKLERLGDDLAIGLPGEALARLRATAGDTLEVKKHPEGLILCAYDAEFSRQMKAVRHVMEKHKDVLRMLSAA